MSSKYIWLVRHSESQGNLERRIQGWKDYPLTTLGRRQAARLAETMAQEEGIEKIYTSPLKRAATTAEIVAAVLGLEVEHDCRLMEYNFGPLNGLTRDEIKAQYPQVWQAWQMNEFWMPLPGEEGEQKFDARRGDEHAGALVAGGGRARLAHLRLRQCLDFAGAATAQNRSRQRRNCPQRLQLSYAKNQRRVASGRVVGQQADLVQRQ